MSTAQISNMDFDLTDSLKYLNIRSLECCGWLEVSGLGYYRSESIKNELEKLFNGDILIIPENDWSEVEGEEVQFTLFCVITNVQEKAWKETLEELGWVKVCKFINPNTDNVCNQYVLIPEELKVP